jgi:hypothetical protein
MTYITQYREPSKDGATLSKVFIGEQFICDVLEDVVREQLGTPVASWKIHGQTAIPSGVYTLELQDSNRFGPDTLTVMNVPGFQYIRIHGGNTAANTEGCLLPGTRNSSSTVAGSQAALLKLRSIILPCFRNGFKVFWEIKPAPMEA